MKKSNLIILSALGAIFVFSIAFQLAVNRHLRDSPPIKTAIKNISEERSVAGFNKIHVSDGIELYFIQDSLIQIKVVAPESIIANIITEVENETLTITNTGKTKDKYIMKVSISNDQLSELKVNSGAYFETIGNVTGKSLSLEFGSDTKANLELSYKSVKCKAASGSEVKFKGNTSNIEFSN